MAEDIYLTKSGPKTASEMGMEQTITHGVKKLPDKFQRPHIVVRTSDRIRKTFEELVINECFLLDGLVHAFVSIRRLDPPRHGWGELKTFVEGQKNPWYRQVVMTASVEMVD